jgi:hypothetical protein
MSTRTGRNYSEKTPTVPSVAVVPAVPAVPAVVAEMEILKDSGGKIGDPTQHHRYSSLKEGHFSDFTLTWNEKKYSVHRCILFHESKLFQEMFTNEWKDVTEAEITIPNKVISIKAIEAFLLFIYTSLITFQDLKDLLFDLYELSIHFKVNKLQFLCIDNFQRFLNVETAEGFLPWSQTHCNSKMEESFASFLASNYKDLLTKSFPFHKAGKTIILKFFKKLAAIISSTYSKITLLGSASGELELSIGNPSIHPQFDTLKNGEYSDLVLKWNRNEYLLHKYVLLSGSVYFRTLLNSHWKESTSGEVKIPGKGISKKAFEDFLAFLYTGLIEEADLKTNLFELYDLSDYFQVPTLKDLVKSAFRKYLTFEAAKTYLVHVRERNAPDLIDMMANFIALYVLRLTDFPFDKVGKLMLMKILRRIVKIVETDAQGHGIQCFPPSSTATAEPEEEDEEIEEF